MEWDEHIKEVINQQLKGNESAVMFSGGSDFNGPQWMRNFDFIRRFGHSSQFNSWCSAVVLTNAAFIGADTTITMGDALQGHAAPTWLGLVHSVFTVCFAIELAIRLFALRRLFFFGQEWRWNIFDFVLVLSALAEEILDSIGPVGFLRVFRGLRMLRVLRLVRVFRVMRDLRLMVCSVFQSFISFFWALMLLFVITYLAAVFFMQGALMHWAMGGPKEQAFLQEASLWYGNLWIAFVTMIMCITGGVDWNEVMRPLSQIHWFYEAVFVLYILFVVIGVLNVLTGIFVERAQELSGLDRDLVIQGEIKRNEAFLTEMKGIFEEADVDGSGFISWEEFREYLKNPEVKAYLSTQQLDTYDARQLFNILEREDDKEVGIEDFIMGCMRLKGQAKSADLVALLQDSRKQNRRVRDNMSDIQDQLHAIAELVGGQVHFEECPIMSGRASSVRRPSAIRKRSYIEPATLDGHSMYPRKNSSDGMD